MPALPSKQTVFLALALVSLVVVQGVGIWGEREAAGAMQRRQHTVEVLLSISAIRETTRLNEARFREYLVSGEEPVADHVGVGLADSRKRRAHARELARDNAGQLERLDRLDAKLAQVSGTFVRLIDARRAQGGESAARLTAAAAIPQLTGDAEGILDELETEENRRLVERDARAKHFAAITSMTTKAGGFLTLLFGGLAWRALRQHARARSAADAQKLDAVAQFRGLMESSPDAIWISQQDRVVYANPAFARLLGHPSPEYVVGRSPFGFVRPDFHEHTRGRSRALEAGQPVDTIELVYVRSDGTQIPVEVSTVRARFNGQPCVQVIARDLTERKRAEQALAKSAAEIQDLYHNSPCGYHSVDMEGVFVAVNDTELAWFGRTREELVGKMKHRDLVTPDTLAAYDEGFARFKKHGEVWDLEFKIARRDGTVMDMLLNATSVRDAAGRVLHSRSTMFDITDRRRAEIALAESEESLAVTLHSIGDGVLATDAAGGITRLNAVAELLTGWTQAEAAGRPVAEVLHVLNEETRQPASLPVADTLAQGTRHGLANHTVLMARDGTERPIADSCAPIRNRAGRVIGAVLVFRDVTQERAAERAVQAGKRALESVIQANQRIMEHSLDVICTIDEQGRFVSASAASMRVWGYRPDELAGRSYLDFVCAEDHARTAAAAADIIAGQPVQEFENRYLHKDGSVVPVAWSAAWSAADRTMFCVAHDITKRKHLLASLEHERYLLRELMDHATQSIYFKDREGRFIRINRCLAARFGLRDAAEAAGRTDFDFFTAEHARKAQADEQQVLRTGQPVSSEEKELWPDGQVTWALTTKLPLHDESGGIVGTFGLSHDITARKQVEQIHLQFRALFESLPGLYLVLKPDFTIVAVSDAYLRATMTKREEIMGRGLFDVFPDNPGDPAATGTAKLRASLDRVLLGAAADPMAIQRYDVRRPDGTFEERFWSPVNSPVFGADHRLEYIIHRVEDVTAFMRQKQQSTPEDTVMLTRMEQMEAEVYRSAQEVQAARDQLEQRVKERTAELAATNRELRAEIAAREQSQLALSAAEAKFRALVEQSLVGIYVIQDGHYPYVNPRMEEIFGFSAEEFSARPVLDFIFEADRPLVQENIRRRLEGEMPSIRYQLRMMRRDGTVVQVEVHGARSEFNGRPAILGTLVDITEQKLAEQRLAAERQLLRTLIDNLPSHIYVKDTAGRYLISNASHTGLLGAASEGELLGKTVADFFPPEIARAFAATDESLLQGGPPIIEHEERYEARGGHGWHSATKVPLRDSQGRIIGLIGIRHDISERKRAEEELKFYTASLERSNRELQDFASVASHDLQEPLRKIQAFGDRLKARAGTALDEAGRDYLDRMQNAAARMQTLVNDLLTFSRVTSRAQPFGPADLAEITREVLSDLETRLERSKGRVEMADLPVIEADTTQMRQLLQNLIANALKFHRRDEPPAVKVYCERDGDCVRLCVSDNGIGFDEKYLDRIFTIFQRLHGREEYEGTGVGLAVCRKIAHRHGGTITARSQPGQGATFIVTLPVRQSKEGDPV